MNGTKLTKEVTLAPVITANNHETMTAEELDRGITASATLSRIFTERKVVKSGEGFHYTQHYEAIKKSGRLLGAPLNDSLATTQSSQISTPASDPDGIVFAYQTVKGLEKAPDPLVDFDGCGLPPCHVIRLRFKSAIWARHAGDREEQLLIPVSEIEKTEGLGRARDVRKRREEDWHIEEIPLTRQ